MKNILPALLFAGVLLGTPIAVAAVPAIEVVDIESDNVSVSLTSENVLRVVGAAGQTLHIYNVTGVRVMTIKVDGSDKSYTLNLTRGCYIVKVGNVVRKISIK